MKYRFKYKKKHGYLQINNPTITPHPAPGPRRMKHNIKSKFKTMIYFLKNNSSTVSDLSAASKGLCEGEHSLESLFKYHWSPIR